MKRSKLRSVRRKPYMESVSNRHQMLLGRSFGDGLHVEIDSSKRR